MENFLQLKTKNHNLKPAAGFTLIEVLIALSVGATIATIITLVTSTGLKNVRAIKHTERLQANGIFIADALTYWIKQGVYYTIIPPSTLQILLPDSTLKTIAKTGNRVTLDGAALTSDDAQVPYLAFKKLDHSVRFGFTLKYAAGSETFSATTTVAQRNTL